MEGYRWGERFEVMMRLGFSHATRAAFSRRECLTRKAASDGGGERLEHHLGHRKAQRVAHVPPMSPMPPMPPMPKYSPCVSWGQVEIWLTTLAAFS